MGPLAGVKVIELAGLGPTPFCGMLLGDMGADVIRIDRPTSSDLGVDFPLEFDLRNRNKRSVVLDLKSESGRAALASLIEKADILIEGYRPGVAERLGFGPDDCARLNPRLVYGRATGWGQDGPRAQVAGHDINYIAVTGALDRIGSAGGPPIVPLNLLGDYAGGGTYLAFGLVCALTEARQSGQGQVVDSAMIDGVTSLMSVFFAFQQMGQMRPERGANLLDGGAPYYGCYQTRDGKYMAVGPIESRFYQQMVELLELNPATLPDRGKRENWPRLREIFAARFLEKTRDEWSSVFDGTDACVSPVLALDEVMDDAHNRARGVLTAVEGVAQPTPAPRLSRTPGAIARGAPAIGAHSLEVMSEWGLDDVLIKAAALEAKG